MTVPLIILAGLSLVGGFMGLPAGLGLPHWLDGWLEPVFETMRTLTHAEAHHPAIATEITLLIISSVIALAGIGAAIMVYIRSPQIADNAAQTFAWPYKMLFNKYWVDEFYNAAFVFPGRKFGQFLANIVDIGLIDGVMVDGSARFVGLLGRVTARWQTGYIRNYVTAIFIGALIVCAYFFLR
jgi:NADH-quinone oxidoreductase subunit L